MIRKLFVLMVPALIAAGCAGLPAGDPDRAFQELKGSRFERAGR